MGIKGLYRELGPGRRVSLSKLAADSFEVSNRPFRVAVDVAIWQFQAQAARGGANPEIRTLFYRLVRLLGTPVQPIFVFDGPQKPRFKRNRWTGLGHGGTKAQAKLMMQLFGFATHDAPGEAEAECALLQKQGIVDAVLSEDVDTLMFGCTRMLRSWSAAEGRSSKTPTHVSLYDVHGERQESVPSLDAEGMILVALMSGGDYIPEGIPGCGIKVACEAAKAGFGRSLCQLDTSDEEGLRTWREDLAHELHSNEKGHFRTKHPGLTVPGDFPNLEVLRFYTDPVVSNESSLSLLRQDLTRNPSPRLDELRDFARSSIGWDHRIGAIKFIRVMSQALLVHSLCQEDVAGKDLVKRISARRQHFTTDGTAELRLSYVPSEVVPIDLARESEETTSACDGQTASGGGGGDDEFFEADADDPKLTALRTFDVTKPDLTWVLEEVARKRVPRAVEVWEEAESAKLAKAAEAEAVKAARAANRAKSKTGMPRGALDGFVRVTKVSSVTAPAPVPDGPSKQLDFLRPAPSPLSADISKQPPGKRATAGAAAIDKAGGSPVAPRLPKSDDGRPETVQLSSGPAGPLSSPRRRPRGGLSRAAGSGKHVPPPRRRQEVREKDTSKKQTSIDSFVIGAKKGTAPVSETISTADEEKKELSSSFSDRQMTTTEKKKQEKEKKTLMTARGGFVYETEMDEDERESRLREDGVAGRVAVRRSDVFFVDLTGE
ncbi:hypothetical protein CP532_1740 [Ophiocordyceps camponoti-leonardi (nom. inval.)]|nr:hypothetical protein CP532_1740 [Ophiocordyceps camponoti-leonardi (nom. inval.)]